MRPDPDPSGKRFALLGSGANFSCEVLQALLRRNYPPRLLVLPEYAPARCAAGVDSRLVTEAPRRRLLTLAQSLEIAYAPAAKQSDLAGLIEQREIDFLLVACWPYLITGDLRRRAGKAALNLHPSLLPKYRGPNPLESQLATADTRFGVTLHLLDQHFDHGNIVARAELAVAPAQRQRTTLERLCAGRGAELFIEAATSYPRWNTLAQSA